MEELIKKADSTKSFMGEACFITAFLGIGLSGIVILMSFGDPKLRGIDVGVGGLAGSIGIGALGTIANNSRRSAELQKLLVQSTNSASELPVKGGKRPSWDNISKLDK